MKPYNTEQTKKEEVREMFDNIAPKYDLLNHTLSMSIDRIWRRRVVRIVRRCRPHRILDVATGTGDLAIEMARRIRGVQVLGVDLSEGMLDVARRKVTARGLDGRVVLDAGDAEHLHVADASVDVATVAFGVRNFGDLDAGLREMARTIKPGGKVVVLEFSRPRNRLFRALYEFYTYKILPRIGGMVSKDKRAYEYLPASVGEFPAPKEFMAMMERAGFRECRARSQSFRTKVTMNAKRIRPGSAPSDNRFCRRIRSSEEDASAGQARSCSAAAGGGASGSPLCRRSGAAGGVSGCGRTLGRMLFCILLLGVVLPLGSCRRMAEKAQRNIRLEAVEKARRQGLSGAEIVLRVKNGTGHKLKLEKASLTVYYAGGVVTKVALREPAEAPRRATASVTTLWRIRTSDPMALHVMTKKIREDDISKIGVSFAVEGRGGPARVKISREMMPLSEFLNIFGLSLNDVKNYLEE